MKTLLIGGTGQVGHELASQLPAEELVVTTRSGEVVRDGADHVALDVTDLDAIRTLIAELAPARVVNAAAHTAVDRAESEPELAFRINAEAPRAMAEACASLGARLVHYSTDYVFDGGGGLGRIINLGFGQQDYAQIIAGALLVAVLALLTEALLVLLSAALTPGPRRWSLPRPWRRQGGPQPSAVPL